MKLLFINYQALPIPPVKGGAVEYLVDSFLKFNEEKGLYDITLYSIFDALAEKEAKNYKYTKFNFIKIKGLKDKLDRIIRHLINRYTLLYIGNTYISKIIKNEKNLNQYDAIIIENAPEFVLKVPKKYKGRIILHLHNDYLRDSTKNSKKIFKRCNEIYTISDTLGEYVKTIKASSKVKTLYNGVDLKRFKENPKKRNEIRKEYDIKNTDKVFMYVGRITPDKGALEMVEAFSQIKNENIKLIVVGAIGYSNSATNDYLEKIKSSANKNVIFTGFIPYEKINDIYNIADIGIVPSICNDAFNLTLVEFFSNGIPVIISDRGAMKELVNDKCSVVAKYDEVNFKDNIKECMEYMLNADIEEMGKEAKIVSVNFSIDAYNQRFNELLKGTN